MAKAYMSCHTFTLSRPHGQMNAELEYRDYDADNAIVVIPIDTICELTYDVADRASTEMKVTDDGNVFCAAILTVKALHGQELKCYKVQMVTPNEAKLPHDVGSIQLHGAEEDISPLASALQQLHTSWAEAKERKRIYLQMRETPVSA